jgi:hypothetical protein
MVVAWCNNFVCLHNALVVFKITLLSLEWQGVSLASQTPFRMARCIFRIAGFVLRMAVCAYQEWQGVSIESGRVCLLRVAGCVY